MLRNSDRRSRNRNSSPLSTWCCVYGADGALLGPLAYLVQDVINLEQVRLHLSFEAYNYPDKEQVKALSLGLPIAQLGYHLQHTDTGDLHLIEELEIWGDFAISRTEVALTLANLGGRIYGAGEATIAGHPTVWVGTSNQAMQTTTISWQATGQQRSVPPSQPIHFPGLLALFSPQAGQSSTT